MPFLLLACVFNSRDAHHGMERKAAFGAMGIAYLLFSGVTYFAWQVDLAPAEIILGLALLFAFFHPLIELSPRKLCAAAALFGSLCVSFDFLRGLIPSALALLIGMFAIEPSADEASRVRKAWLAAASFVFAIIFAFVLKQAAVAVFAPSNGVSVATGQLAVHISQSTWDVNPSAIEALARHGVSVEAIKSNRLFAFIYALAKLAYFSDLLAFGIRPLGVLIVVVGPAALVALGCIRLWRPSPALPRVAAALLVLSVFVPLAWVFIFIEHTIDTAVIMQRMLAWPAILLAGVAAKLISLRREQHVAVRNPAAGKVAVVEPDI
jgi:hypothetical protein